MLGQGHRHPGANASASTPCSSARPTEKWGRGQPDRSHHPHARLRPKAAMNDAIAAMQAAHGAPHRQARIQAPLNAVHVPLHAGHPPQGFCDILLEGPGARRRPVPAHLLSAGRCPELTACASRTKRRGLYAELAFQILSLYIDDIPAATCAPCAPRPTRRGFWYRHRDHATALPPAGADGLCPSSPSNGPTLAFRTWPCSCWATCSNTNWGRGEAAEHPSAPPAATPQCGRVRHARQEGVRVFMTSPTAA